MGSVYKSPVHWVFTLWTAQPKLIVVYSDRENSYGSNYYIDF